MTGLYNIRGWGAKRALPHFDDLVLLGGATARYGTECLSIWPVRTDSIHRSTQT